MNPHLRDAERKHARDFLERVQARLLAERDALFDRPGKDVPSIEPRSPSAGQPRQDLLHPQRDRAVRLALEGMEAAKVAQACGCSAQAVRAWVREAKARGEA